MAKKSVNKVIEVGFIPGIYNYCDRWCEKCDQQLHCVSYVMGRKIEEKGGFKFNQEISLEGNTIWKRLKQVFDSTYQVLKEVAEERGIKLEDIYAAENIDREFWGEAIDNRDRVDTCNTAVEQSDIIRICLIYEDLADKGLERIFEYLDKKPHRVPTPALDEALEVVNWYLDLIQAKMRRALYGYFSFELFDQGEREDYNGSAKVALIAIDRSLKSWQKIKTSCPEFKETIDHLKVVLAELRKEIQKLFPEARDFQRPGFEKPVLFGGDVPKTCE